MKFALPAVPFPTRGGTAVPHRKDTAQKGSVTLPPPKQVVLPLRQHMGVPCTPLVKVGDKVQVGQKIADSDAFMSAPIHASISGTVTSVGKTELSGSQEENAIVINSDDSMSVTPDAAPPEAKTSADFLRVVRESGLVGLGGDGFPTHVKLKVPDGKTIDTLIVNAAECEPVITSDNRCALEETENIFAGIHAVQKWLGIHRIIIAAEGNKPDVIAHFRQVLTQCRSAYDKEVCVLKLRSRYPQGEEKVLIKSCTGRAVPMGGLPSDVGCIVMNVSSVAFLGSYLKTGMPLVRRRVTIAGSAIADPKNVIVPIGTPIRAAAEFCGGYREAPAKILMGGPMMGIALASDRLPILKQTNGILFLTAKEARLPEPTACIRCGRCVAQCPMGLEPTLLEKFTAAKRADKLTALNIMNCMECGTCAYNCPAGRPLVQVIRLGKALVKAEEKK